MQFENARRKWDFRYKTAAQGLKKSLCKKDFCGNDTKTLNIVGLKFQKTQKFSSKILFFVLKV